MTAGRHAIIKRAKIRRCREAIDGKCYSAGLLVIEMISSAQPFRLIRTRTSVPISKLSLCMEEFGRLLAVECKKSPERRG